MNALLICPNTAWAVLAALAHRAEVLRFSVTQTLVFLLRSCQQSLSADFPLMTENGPAQMHHRALCYQNPPPLGLSVVDKELIIFDPGKVPYLKL